MDSHIIWFVVAFGLLVAELLTGTFYLLVIALALGVAGVAAWLGAPVALQFVLAAAIGLGCARPASASGCMRRATTGCSTWTSASRCGSSSGRRPARHAPTTAARSGTSNWHPASNRRPVNS